MPDPRVSKLAKVLVQYSVEVQKGQQIAIRTSPVADELALAVYEEVIKAGGHPLVFSQVPGTDEIFFRYASDEQLDYISPVSKLILDTFDASISIRSEYNTRKLSGISPERISRSRKAQSSLMKSSMKRTAEGTYKWTVTVYPCHAMAQEADMSLADYTEFVYGAGFLDQEDPLALWREEEARQKYLIGWLKGREQAVIRGANIDITLSIRDRVFVESAGKRNFPSGEIFTGPVEDSVNGWVRFKYPAIYSGQEIEDIELWFENGKVVKEKATKNQELLTSTLNTDAGSRYLGEWGIGTNYRIQRFTKNMLFDEKIGGTIHFAVGAGYPQTKSRNESAIHWDMLCDMAESEINLDGELFYKNGKTVI